MRSKYAGKLLAPVMLVFVTSCSSTGGMNGNVGDLFTATADNRIRIESEPSGAAVYVMDKMVGSTPLDISNKDVFPTVYPKAKESLYGKVTLKQAGCADFTSTINSSIINSGLHAHLDCGGGRPAPATAPSEPHSTGEPPRVNAPAGNNEPHGDSEPRSVNQTVEQRLQRIKDLLDKGLILEDEAKKARERILNNL